MKLTTSLIMATAMITTSAMAQTNTIAVTQPITESVNTLELNRVFDTTQSDQLQALELSKQEMKETEGAWVPLFASILMGGAIGAWGNHGVNYYQTGQFASAQSTMYATGAGMIGGAYSHVMLSGAGIATSAFAPSAWQGTTGIANVTIRTNGAMLGQSYSGVHRINVSNTSPTYNYTPQPTFASNMSRYNVPLGYGYR